MRVWPWASCSSSLSGETALCTCFVHLMLAILAWISTRTPPSPIPTSCVQTTLARFHLLCYTSLPSPPVQLVVPALGPRRTPLVQGAPNTGASSAVQRVLQLSRAVACPGVECGLCLVSTHLHLTASVLPVPTIIPHQLSPGLVQPPCAQFHTSDSAYFDLQPAQGDSFLEHVGKRIPVVV